MITSASASRRWAWYLSITLFVVVTIVFIIAFIVASQNETTDIILAADTYGAETETLLANANSQNGNALLDQHDCVVCHRVGAGRIAPGFAGIAIRASERRPPLAAAAYLYESITDPGAYIVEGYANVMPSNFLNALSEEELGDILAYLLTEDAE